MKYTPKLVADHGCCPQMVTREVSMGTFNIATGKSKQGKAETVTEACNTPLFGKQVAIGFCREHQPKEIDQCDKT